MRRLRGSMLAGLILTALTALSHAADAPEDLKIKNLMPEFWSFQAEVPQLQKADRILRRFREQIIEPNRDIYSKPEFKDVITDAGILDYLKAVNSDLATMRSLSTDLEPLTREMARKLKKEFPRFDTRLTVVFMPTLHQVDGHYTRIVDQPTVLFGLDAIARFRGPQADWRVLLVHELFHAHHARVNAALYREAPMPLYTRIWIEGLAAYVSGQLNPEASSQQIIGDGSSPVDRNAAQMGPVVGMIRGSMDSTNPAEQGKFLTYTAATAGVPVRAGYLVGFEVAKALAVKYDLGELATLRGGKLRNLMSKQLEQMSADYLAQQPAPSEGRAARAQ
jgi:hypothetical protein